MRADRIDFRVILLLVAKLILLIAMIFPINPKSLFGQTQKNSSIEFTATASAAQAHVYNLASTHVPPEFLPTEFLNDKLTPVKLPAQNLEAKTLVSIGTLGKTATDQAADPANADVDLIPNLLDMTSEANLARMPKPATSATIARTARTDVRFIHKDVKGMRLTDAIQAAAMLLFAIGHSILQLSDS
jgi:hypothetical protein